MTHDPNSFKKVAALTGLTVLIGGAEISNAHATTFSIQRKRLVSPSVRLAILKVQLYLRMALCRLRDLMLPWEHSHKWKSN